MQHVFIRTQFGRQGIEEHEIGTTAATVQHLPRALVFKADQVFGRDNWTAKPDATLCGFYALDKTPDRICLFLRPHF